MESLYSPDKPKSPVVRNSPRPLARVVEFKVFEMRKYNCIGTLFKVVVEKPMVELISINQLLDTNVDNAIHQSKVVIPKETKAVEHESNKGTNPLEKAPSPYLEYLQCKKQLTPPENSMFPATMRELRSRVVQVLGALGLSGDGPLRRIGDLSGGE